MMLKQITTIASFLIISYCLALQAFAQENPQKGSIAISGVVVNASTNEPIEGATVATAANNSTFTNKEGEFSLKVTGTMLPVTITADGYAQQIIPLKGRTKLKVKLYEEGYKSFQNNVNLDYTTKPFQYTTRAVEGASFVNDNYKTPGTSAEYLFKNSFAGLQVQSRSGMLGNGSDLTIRGINSLNGTNRPLIVVDGMISQFNSRGKELISGAAHNTLAGISIDDIENVTVIKDGTAIYGAQGANGVIYIQTIKATETATKIQVSSYGGIRYAPEKLPVLKSYNYRSYLSEMLQSEGLSEDSIKTIPYMIDDPTYQDYNRYHNETDWQDQIFQDGIVQNYNLKIKGGDNIALYGLSLGFQQNKGIVKNTDYQRYSIRFNSDIKVSQKVKVDANISWSSGIRNLNDDGIAPVTNPFHVALRKAPFLYFKKIGPNGEISPRYEDADILGISNPVALIDRVMALERDNTTVASLKLSYLQSKHITLSNRIGINYFKTRFNTFIPHTGVSSYVSDLGIIENTMQNKVESKYAIFNDTRINYLHKIGENQTISAIAGARIMVNQAQEDWAVAHNSPNDQLRSIGQGVNLYNDIGGYLGNWNSITYYANVDYDYLKKYFLTLGLSLDGSSRYGNQADGLTMFNHKFAFFPSLTAAWLISSENFMQDIDAISLAKVRLGYSVAGNDDIGNYAAQKYYITQNLRGAMGLVSGNLYNPALQWETTSKVNLGFDLGLFNDRISLSADYFQNQTTNLLTVIQPLYVAGYSNYLDNVGSLKTDGFDLHLNTRIIDKAVKWDFGVNLMHYSTVVNDYFNNQEIFDVLDGQVIVQKGQPLGQFYGYKTKGVFASDEEAQAANLSAEMPNSDLVPFKGGDVIFEDVNGDHKINEKDRQVIGNPAPKLTGSFSTSVSWNGLTLDATLAFSYGNDIYNYLRRDLESMSTLENQSEVVLNRWQVQGQQTNIPKAVYGDPLGNSRFSDRWIEDGSYLRLQNVSLNYRLPLKKLKQTFDVFVVGQNLVTLTKYLGLDPEFSLGDSPLLRGIDVGMTPQPKAVYAGIKIGI